MRRIAQHIGSGNANHCETLRAEPCIPSAIAVGVVAHVMGDSVHLDDQAPARAVEVDHQFPDRVMIAELHAVRPLAQLVPQ
jgi:hypothetical protein